MEATAQPSGDGARALTDRELAELLFDDLRTMPGGQGSIPQFLRARIGNQFSDATLMCLVAHLAHTLVSNGCLDSEPAERPDTVPFSIIRAQDLPGLPISSDLRDRLATICESGSSGIQRDRQAIDALIDAVIRLEARIEGVPVPG